jgi:hypothetical protein
MRFRGDVVKTPDNPTKGRVGLDGNFMVLIYSDDSPGSVTNWELFEVTAEGLPYEECLSIESKRLQELRAQIS